MVELALIADDLTGAADSGVQFVKRGRRTALLLEQGLVGDAEVVVVDTESRADTAGVARDKVHSVASSLRHARFIYKKIDSTLRGNLGAELEAVMEALHIDRALVAPAFPLTGRTTVRGRQLLDGQLLEDTAFAHDPLCPVTDSYIPDVLARQMQRQTGLIGLNLVRAGVKSLASTMKTRRESVLVLDATTEGDLLTIARAAVQADLAHLTCGSAGLADALAEVVVGRCTESPVSTRSQAAVPRAPVLVVAASRNPLTGLQLSRATREIDLELLRVDTGRLSSEAEDEVARLVERATVGLCAGHSVALCAVDSPYVPGLSHILAEALGRVAALLVSGHALAGLVLTGGDVSRAVCRALGTTALTLLGEVAPGMPLGQIRGGPRAGLHLVTKAGGFGGEDAILTAIRHLQGVHSS
jgi:uncharacterized protein YgbK (DUF1537 family)